jgi:hypothetical protein
MAKRFPWKSHFNKLPAPIQRALDDIIGDQISVAATKKVLRADVERGQYAHLGLTAAGGEIHTSGPALPPSDAGKWSARNANGWDRKRADWPMVKKTTYFESPNFGDAATYGTHMHSFSRDVYQHQVFEPQGMTIEPDVLEDRGGELVVIKFILRPMLERGQGEFELMLLWAINVLQENTGVTGVAPSDATHEEFISTITLDWQVFPHGTAEETIARITGGARPANLPDFEKHVRDRVRLFEQFQPTNYLRGQGGFGSYFGALFADDLVVFENLRYGNAVYVLYEDWDEVSRRSRLELLRDRDAHFGRVIHKDGWEKQLAALISDQLFQRGLRRRRSGGAFRRG